MCEAGILPSDADIELIGGEIYYVVPEGPLHASSRTIVTKRLMLQLDERCLVWPHNPICFGDDSIVQPDVTLLRPEQTEYCHRYPAAADVRVGCGGGGGGGVAGAGSGGWRATLNLGGMQC